MPAVHGRRERTSRSPRTCSRNSASNGRGSAAPHASRRRYVTIDSALVCRRSAVLDAVAGQRREQRGDLALLLHHGISGGTQVVEGVDQVGRGLGVRLREVCETAQILLDGPEVRCSARRRSPRDGRASGRVRHRGRSVPGTARRACSPGPAAESPAAAAADRREARRPRRRCRSCPDAACRRPGSAEPVSPSRNDQRHVPLAEQRLGQQPRRRVGRNQRRPCPARSREPG